MIFKFGRLPDDVLLEVFYYIESKQLLEVRFLNKRVFKIVEFVIQEYLKVSKYGIEGFKEIQKDFINKNSSSVRKLKIHHKEDIESFESCKNINKINLFYKNFPVFDINPDKYSNLTSMNITIFRYGTVINYTEVLEKLKNVIYRLERFKLSYQRNVNLELILSALNPDKLKELTLRTSLQVLNIEDFSKFEDFKVLHCLSLEFFSTITSQKQNDLSFSPFPSLNELEIKGNFSEDFDFSVFGNLPSSTMIKLNLAGNQTNMLKFITKNKVKEIKLSYDFDYIHYSNADDIIASLKPILIPKSITTVILKNLNATEMNSLVTNEINEKYYGIKEISFINSNISFQGLFALLYFFPNVIKIRFEGNILSNDYNKPFLHPKNPNELIIILPNRSLPMLGSNFENLINDINIYSY